MTNMFERLAATSRQVVERVHGKAVTIYPVSSRDVNAEATASIDDPQWDTVACFFENTLLDSEARAQPSGDGRRVMHRSLQKQASIRLVEGRSLKTGYKMRRHEDDAWFTISSFDPDGLGQIMAVIAPSGPFQD